MTFDEFKDQVTAKHSEKKLRFEEHGKHGWTTVLDILNKEPGGRPGPHWCDASFVPRTERLAGSYNFNTGEAEFF